MTETDSGTLPATDAIAPETEPVESSTTPETTTPDDAGQQPETERDERGRFTGVQKRFDEMTREKYDAIRERDFWRQRALEREEAEMAKPDPAQAVATPEPSLEDFGYDEGKFKAAWKEWNKATIKAEIAAELQAEREAARKADREHRHQARLAAYAVKAPEFVAKINDPYLPVSPAMADVIRDSESGPELLNWIADNREKAASIYRLPPHIAAKELGRVETMLEAEKRKPPPPPVTKAPPPPPTLEANDAPEPERDPAKMTDAEFAKWRRKQIAQRR